MTVKELITELLDMPMDSEVYVNDNTEHIAADGKTVDGYLYEIEDVAIFNNNTVNLQINNWRDRT